MSAQFSAFVCKHPGMVAGDVKLVQKTNFDGEHYWYASKEITHLLGSEVHGCVVEGFGRTQEIAIERLKKDEAELYESLWF